MVINRELTENKRTILTSSAVILHSFRYPLFIHPSKKILDKENKNSYPIPNSNLGNTSKGKHLEEIKEKVKKLWSKLVQKLRERIKEI